MIFRRTREDLNARDAMSPFRHKEKHKVMNQLLLSFCWFSCSVKAKGDEKRKIQKTATNINKQIFHRFSNKYEKFLCEKP